MHVPLRPNRVDAPGLLPAHRETVGADVEMPVRQRMQDSAGRRADGHVLLPKAFMCRWFVNVPWLLRIDVLHM